VAHLRAEQPAEDLAQDALVGVRRVERDSLPAGTAKDARMVCYVQHGQQ
jgi:hypothetical protein